MCASAPKNLSEIPNLVGYPEPGVSHRANRFGEPFEKATLRAAQRAIARLLAEVGQRRRRADSP